MGRMIPNSPWKKEIAFDKRSPARHHIIVNYINILDLSVASVNDQQPITSHPHFFVDKRIIWEYSPKNELAVPS